MKNIMPFFSVPEKKQLTIAQVDALKKGRGHKPSRVRVPANCHEIVKHIFMLIRTEKETIKGLCRKAGVSREFLTHARRDSRPSLEAIEACVNALGYSIVLVPTHWDAPRRIYRIRDVRDMLEKAKADGFP
jgi:hypothetical protein